MEFENVIKRFNQYKGFTEIDETQFDYLDDNEFYERTSDYRMSDDGEYWDFPDDVREWGYGF